MAEKGGNTVPRIAKSEHIGPDDTGDNIEAKRVAGYIWNPATSTWERSSGSSGEFDVLIETDSGDVNIQYIGKAAPGSVTSSAVWQIQEVDETTGTQFRFADGDSNFDNVWDNRESLTY